MKKLISLLLAVTLVCTMLAVPVMAAPTSIYEDYVPGDKPANLIVSKTESSPTWLQYFTQGNSNAADVKISWNSWTAIKVASQKAYDGTTLMGKTNTYYLPGAYIHGAIMPDDSVEEGNSYVVSYWVKATEGLDGVLRDTKTNVGITNFKTTDLRMDSSVEYGEEGMDVVGTEWQQFNATIPVTEPHSTLVNQRTAIVHIGLSTKAPQGTALVISDGLNGEPGKVYFAEEAAYDITNSVTSSNAVEAGAGENITLEATVENQIGSTGTLKQEFIWKALDSATRTNEILGITVTPDAEDSSKATVSVAAIVPEGEYDIVAYSQEYGMAKGCTISVSASTAPIPTLEGIEITAPDKTEYIEGQELDLEGLAVALKYSDGTTIPVTSGYTVTGYDKDAPGTQTVTVSYEDLEATFEVSVTAKVLEGIELTPPTKTEYNTLEEIDYTGMVVKALYSGGTDAVITEGYTISECDMVVGTQTITVSYGGFEASFEVNISEPLPIYTDYEAPQELNGNLYATDQVNSYTARWLATFDAIAPNHANGVEGAMRYPIAKAPQYWGDSSVYQVAGGDMTGTAAGKTGLMGYKYKANTNYVLKTELKNHPDSTVNESRFVYQINSKDSQGNRSLPAAIFTITSKTEYQTFTAVLPVEYAGEVTSNLHYGYPNHTSLHNEQGTDILHRIGSFYFAEEQAKDIILDGSDDMMCEDGEGITVTAEITNQLDIPYEGDTSLEWYVTDTNRTRKISGFDIEVSADGLSATVEAAKGAVEPGTYTLVAEDNTLGVEGFRKGFDFVLEGYYFQDIGDLSVRAKLDVEDSQWTTEAVTTGLVNNIVVEATLAGNTEAFDWYVLDGNRRKKVYDFEISAQGSGEVIVATVKAANSVSSGDYYVVAEASDGSLAAQPIIIDKAGDLAIIKGIILSGDTEEIQAGLDTAWLDILEIPQGYASKANHEDLAELLADSAREENLSEAGFTETREIINRLALVSFYNEKPDDVELFDGYGKFEYAADLKLSDLDSDGVTLLSAFNNLASDKGRKEVQAALMGKGFTKYSQFMQEAIGQMLTKTLAYPKGNGIGYVSQLLTRQNLELAGIDPDNYLGLSDVDAYNDTIARNSYSLSQLKSKLESAEDVYNEDDDDDDDRGSVSRGGGGGGFSISTKDEDNKEDDNNKEEAAYQVPSFKDVPAEHWAYSDIHFLRSLGAIAGVTEDSFEPDSNVTREQFVKIIVEAFGVEADSSAASFADVDASSWYAPYVNIAVASGIVNGTGDNSFGVGQAITRQDVCTIVARALGFDNETEGDLSFTDVESISEYAKTSVAALAGYAIITGFPDGSFGPQEICSRAQAAKIIANAIGIANALAGADGR